MAVAAAPRDAVSVRPWKSRLPFGYVLGVVALAAAYYGAAHLGYALKFSGPVAAIVWLPVGVGISFLYLGGLRLWPGVLIGDLLANNYSTLPAGSAIGQSCGNVLEVLVATVLIQRLNPVGSPLASLRGLGSLVVGIAAGTAVSATVGVMSLRLGDVIAAGEIPGVWRTWSLGDASGALVLVPLALAWYRPVPRNWWSSSLLEPVVMVATLVGLSELAFHTHRPLTYIVFPALIWSALRFGERGATLAIAVVTGLAVVNTTHFLGPFVYRDLNHSVLSTQLFIAVAALTTLCLAAVVSERGRLAERLRASRARLVEAGDAERRRLEHNLHDGAQQGLTTVMYQIHLAAQATRAEPARAEELLEAAETGLSLAIDELRELARGIHPTVLTDLGLARAIESVATRATVPIELLVLPSTRFDHTAEATAYYVILEAIANAQKHAHASSVRVRVVASRQGLGVEVADDGVGGAFERAGSGLGGLRDRVEAIGGRFEMTSDRQGTRVFATIPAIAREPRPRRTDTASH